MICKDFFFLGTRKEKQEKAGSRDLSRDLWSLNPKWVTNDGYCAILQHLTPQHFYAVNVLIIKNVQHHGKENIQRGLLLQEDQDHQERESPYLRPHHHPRTVYRNLYPMPDRAGEVEPKSRAYAVPGQYLRTDQRHPRQLPGQYPRSLRPTYQRG